MCENECKYKFYNVTNGKGKCECPIKKEISDIKIKIISYENMDINTFLDIKTFSNIELIKCFKLAISKAGINKNYGNIILLCNICIFISFITFYEINQKKLISNILRLVLLSNGIKNPPRKKTVSFNISMKNRREHINNNQNQVSQIKEESKVIKDLIDNSINLEKEVKVPKKSESIYIVIKIKLMKVKDNIKR